jgi:hypothetical protein
VRKLQRPPAALLISETAVKKQELTQKRLKELLRYDRKTGIFRWRVRRKSRRRTDIAGCRALSEHWCINIDGRSYRAHQLAWLYMKGEWGRPLIDHRDGNPLNNRWDNLRLASHANNAANRKRLRTNRSGFMGVSFDRRRSKWTAQITKQGKRYFVGRFATPGEAHAAYVAKARELFGEFARAE